MTGKQLAKGMIGSIVAYMGLWVYQETHSGPAAPISLVVSSQDPGRVVTALLVPKASANKMAEARVRQGLDLRAYRLDQIAGRGYAEGLSRLLDDIPYGCQFRVEKFEFSTPDLTPTKQNSPKD